MAVPAPLPLRPGLASNGPSHALFAAFAGTMPASDFSSPSILGQADCLPCGDRCASALRSRDVPRHDGTARAAFDEGDRPGTPNHRLGDASLHCPLAPLPTLRPGPCGQTRTARGATRHGYVFVPRDSCPLSLCQLAWRTAPGPCRTPPARGAPPLPGRRTRPFARLPAALVPPPPGRFRCRASSLPRTGGEEFLSGASNALSTVDAEAEPRLSLCLSPRVTGSRDPKITEIRQKTGQTCDKSELTGAGSQGLESRSGRTQRRNPVASLPDSEGGGGSGRQGWRRGPRRDRMESDYLGLR